jgi:hypothetical protein
MGFSYHGVWHTTCSYTLRNKTMNCPHCQKYIVPEFYCINCGYVPPKMADPDPNNITELEIVMSLARP